MKKFLIPLIPLLLALSCTPAKDSFSYQNFYGFGEVEPLGQIVLSGQSVKLQVIEDQTDGKWMQQQTIFFLCDLTGFTETGAYQATLKMYEPVARKGVVKKSTSDPATYGTDAVALYQDWGSNPKERWIDVACLTTSLKDSQTPHTVNLVLDDVRSNTDTVYLELHHQGSGESFENETWPTTDFQIDTHYLRFDLSGAIPPEARESIVLQIEWDWFEAANGLLLRDKPEHRKISGTFYLTD